MGKTLLGAFTWLLGWIHAPRDWPRHLAACAAVLWLLASCGGGDDGGRNMPPPASAAFMLQVSSASVPAPRGSRGLLSVRVERQGGFSEAIELKLANPPADVSSSTVVVEPDETEAQLPLRLGADVPLGALGIVISGSSGAATATANVQLEVREERPSGRDLIQAALDAGQVDIATSLLYRVYAVFGSSKLPAAYVGSGPTEDMAVFADIERERSNLPPAVLAALKPFLARPDDPESVFSAGAQIQRNQTSREGPLAVEPFADRCPGGGRQWISLRSTQHPVRAFALCLGTLAGDSAAFFDLRKVIATVDKAYGLMTQNMGPAEPDLWGDDAIDVYVVPSNADAPREEGGYAIEGVRGVAIQQPPYAGRTSSGYVMLPRWRLAEDDHFLTIIHELFHVLQFAHNYQLDHWFVEASASWASIHFNRTAGIEPSANNGLHKERFGAYQGSRYGLLSTAGDNEYFSYVWPLFMEQQGEASMIGSAWRQFENVTSPEGATNALDFLLPFRDNFRLFAMRNLNQEFGSRNPLPRAKRYVTLDPPFPDGEALPKDGVKSKNHRVAPDGARQALNFGREIEPLSAVYFDVSVTDATLKKVVFDLSGLQGGGLDVDALVFIDQSWEAEPRNLSAKSEITFCLDDAKERLYRVVFVVSNHQKLVGSQASAEIGVTGETTPCNTVWEGQSSLVITSPGFESIVTASFVFEFDDSVPPTFYQPFRLRNGNWTYNTKSYASPSCTITSQALGTMTLQQLDPAVPTSTHANLDLFTSLSPATYRATGSTAIEYTETDCNGGEQKGNTVIGWLNVEGPGEVFVSDDGNTLEGSGQVNTPETALRHIWKLTRARR